MAYIRLQNDRFVDDATGIVYEDRGSVLGMVAVGTDGAAHVTTSTGSGVAQDREMGALASKTYCTWTVAEDVTRIIVTAEGTVGEACVICFDAPDDATATYWLAGNVDIDGVTKRKVILVGTPREFIFSHPLRRLDALNHVGTVTNLFIEAGK